MKLTKYTISAIYCSNGQRYCTSGMYANPTDAAIGATLECREDNKAPEMNLEILGIFKGIHSCVDISVPASEDDCEIRPDPVRCRAKTTRAFTVVSEHGAEVLHARNAVEAERCFETGDRISGIFRGELDNLVAEVDFDRVAAETKYVEPADH